MVQRLVQQIAKGPTQAQKPGAVAPRQTPGQTAASSKPQVTTAASIVAAGTAAQSRTQQQLPPSQNIPPPVSQIQQWPNLPPTKQAGGLLAHTTPVWPHTSHPAQPAQVSRVAALPSAAAAAPASSFAFGSFSTPQWKVKDKCEAKFSEDGVWYTAVIDSISPDGKLFKVVYTEYGNVEDVPALSLRAIGATSPLPSDSPVSLPSAAVQAPRRTWKAGDVCEGCFTEDSVWYKAKIDKISTDGTKAHVTYVEYGNSEEIPFSALRPLPQTEV